MNDFEQYKEHIEYVGYEARYPKWVPEGYSEKFISNRSYGVQEISYENQEGQVIRYEFYFHLNKWGWEFESDEEPEQVDINGLVGYKTASDSRQGLVWTDEERGFGFNISAPADVDILKIARSVDVGPELVPSNADKTVAALEELGDYQITAGPEGMVEDGLAGWPLEGEEDWYSYVRRWYVNRQTNAQVYFTYETYISDTDSPRALCEMLLGGSDMPLEAVTICGCEGASLQSGDSVTLVWATGDGSKGMLFKMFSEDFTAEELVKIAQSVEKVN